MSGLALSAAPAAVPSRDRYGLTPRQLDCYHAIVDHLDRNGGAPSYQQLCKALDVHSKATIKRLVHGLRERGYVTFREGLARSIALTAPAGYVLPPKLQGALHAYCLARGEPDPSAVVADAVTLFLDEAGGFVAS